MKKSMMVSGVLVLAVVSTIFSGSSRAVELESSAGHFDAMAFLAGHCWKGTFKDRPAVTDEHCFEWVYDKKFLQDKHVVRGDSLPYEGQTLYAWNPQSKRIVYWYIARPGFYSTGSVEASDTRIVFIDDLHDASGKRDLRSVWERTGPNKFRIRTEDHTGGVMKELWSMEMQRVAGTSRKSE